MIVVGAGMAGLLAGAMLRSECTAIYEAAPELPNNHSAVLRFRSAAVSDALNVPFKRVQAFKAIEPHTNPIADAMNYSFKTNGHGTVRSIGLASAGPLDRYIAPPDLIAQMASRVWAEIKFGTAYDFARSEGQPVISTIPMPHLMRALGWEASSNFVWREGYNYKARLLDVEAYCSLYVPDPDFPAARISITGDQLIVETYRSPVNGNKMRALIKESARRMGIPASRIAQTQGPIAQRYGKILPIDENERREFIMWASRVRRVFALGRFATWRPGLLLDDVVQDVRVIQRLAAKPGESYAHQLKG